jgi:hypothetical protein
MACWEKNIIRSLITELEDVSSKYNKVLQEPKAFKMKKEYYGNIHQLYNEDRKEYFKTNFARI